MIDISSFCLNIPIFYPIFPILYSLNPIIFYPYTKKTTCFAGSCVGLDLYLTYFSHLYLYFLICMNYLFLIYSTPILKRQRAFFDLRRYVCEIYDFIPLTPQFIGIASVMSHILSEMLVEILTLAWYCRQYAPRILMAIQ